jgi:hypothetical protein
VETVEILGLSDGIDARSSLNFGLIHARLGAKYLNKQAVTP